MPYFSLIITTLFLLTNLRITWADDVTRITLRAGVLHAPPFAMIEEDDDSRSSFNGFQPDLLKRLQTFALDDNVKLNFILERAPSQYGAAFNLVANDCNTTMNPNSKEDCKKFDLIVGDFYGTPERSVRVDFIPPWLRTTMSSMKYLEKVGQDYTTLTQVSRDSETVCVPDGTFLMSVVMEKFPDANYQKCSSPEDCIQNLKAENCVLYVDDELQLRYRAANDATIEVTKEQFNTQFLVWPMSPKIENNVATLMKKWIYAAVTNATIDELYFKYFQRELCPIGTAGEKCELPCDPDHGESNAKGVCMCVSTRWTGPDCSIEVMENTRPIPSLLLFTGYAMFGINVIIVAFCAGWLWIKRNSGIVRAAQPFFLALILAGCVISSSTIIALGQQDSGNGPVPACAVIPWLYSIGFSVTFGTLFARIRRVYILFKSAVHMRKTKVTIRETLLVIGCVLLLDVVILTIWTVLDPLTWRRKVLVADLFGHPLETQGFCSSNHWLAFGAIIGSFHLFLMIIACYMCYKTRNIPEELNDGKYVSMAMISNFQVFVVGLPIVCLLGSSYDISYFIRCLMIWMNDLVVVVVIFGNLIYGSQKRRHTAKSFRNIMSNAMKEYVHRKSSVERKSSLPEGPAPFQLNVADNNTGVSEIEATKRSALEARPVVPFQLNVAENTGESESEATNKHEDNNSTAILQKRDESSFCSCSEFESDHNC